MWNFYKKEKLYDINNLYVVDLGYFIYKNCGANFGEIGKKTIIEKRKDYNRKDVIDHYIGINPITNVKYNYFSKTSGDFTGQLVISKEVPLSLFFGINKDKLSLSEIKTLEIKLNNLTQEEENEVEDPIIKEIKKLSVQVKYIEEETAKQDIIAKINTFASNYVIELIKIKTGLSMEITETELINMCFKEIKIIKKYIENELQNSNIIQFSNLTRELKK